MIWMILNCRYLTQNPSYHTKHKTQIQSLMFLYSTSDISRLSGKILNTNTNTITNTNTNRIMCYSTSGISRLSVKIQNSKSKYKIVNPNTNPNTNTNTNTNYKYKYNHLLLYQRHLQAEWQADWPLLVARQQSQVSYLFVCLFFVCTYVGCWSLISENRFVKSRPFRESLKLGCCIWMGMGGYGKGREGSREMRPGIHD